jgi:hypothetical protein
LRLDNTGDHPLEDVRILYRLPLEWTDGVVVRRPGPIAAGGSVRDRLVPTRATADAKYTSGSAFTAAQVDFNGGRLHVTSHTADPDVDASYPRNRFQVAGPIGDPDFHPERLPDVGNPVWRTIDPAKSDFLDVEIVPTSLSWRYGGTEPIWYLARSVVQAQSEVEAGIVVNRESVRAVYVNGEAITGPTARLRKGDNRILLVSRIVDKFRPENAGAFFRLTDAAGRRLTTVRYRAD